MDSLEAVFLLGQMFACGMVVGYLDLLMGEYEGNILFKWGEYFGFILSTILILSLGEP